MTQRNDGTELGVEHHRTETEFLDILQKRQEAREYLRQYKKMI